MKDNDLTPENIVSILSSLNSEDGKVMQDMFLKIAGDKLISNIKYWVNRYEPTNPMDVVMARIVNTCLYAMIEGFEEIMKNALNESESDNGEFGKLIIKVAINKCRDALNELESHAMHGVCGSCVDTH